MQKLVNPMSPKTPGVPKFPIKPKVPKFPMVSPPVPPVPSFNLDGGKSRPRQFAGKYGYTPSVGAMLFGITATRRPRVIGEIRPIIVPRGRRKPKPMWLLPRVKKGRFT